MKGILFAIAGGLFISLQQVFNTRLGERIGFWEANTIVHGTGFIFTLLILLTAGKGSLSKLGEVNKLYMLGGVLGVIIVFSVMNAISANGATFTVAVLLITQFVAAIIIDAFGLFDSPAIKLDITKLAGIVIMIAGIIVFKLKG